METQSHMAFSKAKYTLSSLPMYRGNPMIEALEDYLVFPYKSIIERLSQNIAPIDPKANRKQKDNWLANLTNNIFIPLPHHVDLHETVDMLIRFGYSNRKHKYISTEYIDILKSNSKINDDIEKELIAKLDNETNCKYGNSQSLSLIGISGMGKTYAVSRVLSFYPQVIEHDGLRKGTHVIQVVYLKVECPHDGSVKSLCTSIFEELGKTVGENFLDAFVNKGRPSISMLKSRLSHLLAAYNVGILIIDEIQNLLVSKMEREQLFNFIVSMTNELGIPLMFIGTPKAKKIMHTSMRTGRRFGSYGVLQWDRMKYRNNEWNIVFNSLWNHVVAKTSGGPNEEIEKLFYEFSQGITSVLVKLFVLVQKRALILDVEITPELVKNVNKSYLANVNPMIDAIRNNDVRAMEKYEDIAISQSEFECTMKTLSNELDIAVGIDIASNDELNKYENIIKSSLESMPEELRKEIMKKFIIELNSHTNDTSRLQDKIDEGNNKDVMNKSSSNSSDKDSREISINFGEPVQIENK